jgi:LPS O-antigen subunit length determinant protein (WzzB/FepE family)
VVNDADSNQRYLERLMASTSDPILTEKINNMIAYDLEKSMLVSSRAFDILEKPVVAIHKKWPDRKLLIALGAVVGILIALLAIFVKSSLQNIRASLGGKGRVPSFQN